VDTIKPFFEDIKQRGGMYDYIIICDDSNNTPDTIDRNELRVKIGIQPVKTIEFILVDFVASRTGSDWSELATI
jgi:phage tail sheath protein FI